MITIARIQNEVAAAFGIPSFEMRSVRRGREVARPRQVAMYLAKKMTHHSIPEIGRSFGGRDHTTCLWAIKQITRFIDEDPILAGKVRVLTDQLNEPRKGPPSGYILTDEDRDRAARILASEPRMTPEAAQWMLTQAQADLHREIKLAIREKRWAPPYKGPM